ncbi:MAG: hypothetical protein Tp1100DCM1099271_45 [Prokaryotic dsDNA virus sp.]|jgi:hypothetical protein|nr:MAG: hypothetical protein Tp1102SUR405181_29 [Prokaryotic dsDNA virus sp.]QDP60073.1 MAG: hypothetical protein Tp1100DCM1099271_45 [Prokaryotic dsDNA virus sp.]QDP67094.1 MAG: hypothetical protein Tp1111SUR49671_14 [Prokaryotic dsDNA virus sp.]|tara:strand:+ start:24396 stop:24881 length:486 start_codon:yes stop_codon:yes gene_type:complete
MFFGLFGSLINAAFTMSAARQQIQMMKANAAWQKYESELNHHYEKQKRLTEQRKLLSEQRARGAAAGIVVGTGSSLIAMNADMEEFETDLWYMEKGLWVEGKTRDAELAGEIAATTYNAGSSILGGFMQGANQASRMQQASTFGSGIYASGPMSTPMSGIF